MLYTNEPANKIMVALSAHRATNSEHTNKQRQLVLLNALKAGGFEILDDNMIGCYREEGQAEHRGVCHDSMQRYVRSWTDCTPS